MVWALVVSFLISALVTLLVITSSHRHAEWSVDHDLDGPQKMHTVPVPRIGGVGIAIGIVLGATVFELKWGGHGRDMACLLLSALPVFAAGLVEDFTKRVSPRNRLIAAGGSALVGVWLMHATVSPAGWPAFTQLLSVTGLSVFLAVFAVAGVANSVNIIDGMNGLASMCVILMMIATAYVALQVGDMLIAAVALSIVGACLGFFMWNFPRGLIFLGDGGAYLLGFMLAELGLLLIQRNPAVSPMVPIVIAAYPIFETLFTMYRRKVMRGRPMGLPDGIHLHTLLYRRLMRWAVGARDAAALTRGNSMTSPYLWILSTVSIIPAVIWWDDTRMLLLWLLVFVGVYLYMYWRIVTFRTPRWLSSGAGRGRR